MNLTGQTRSLRAVPLGVYIFLGVFVFRLLVLVRLTESQFLLPSSGDMFFYNDWALRILRGNWTDHTAFYGLPLYAYLLAGIYKICGYSPFVPGLLQAGCEGGTAVLLYKLGVLAFPGDSDQAVEKPQRGADLRHGQVIGIAAAMGWAFFQPAQGYSVILMPTAWLVFVFWFVVWQIVQRGQAPPLWQLLLLGGLIGFTAMGIATILFLVPLVLAALFFRWVAPLSYRSTGAIMVLAGVFLGASPAWIHNYFVAHDSVFLSAHSGVNFWIGNNPVATGYPRFPPGLHAGQEAMLKDSIASAEKAAGRPLKRSEVSSYWSQKAHDWIRRHPMDFLKLLGTKFKNFWSAFSYDDISVVTALRDQSVTLPGDRLRPYCRPWPARPDYRVLEISGLALDCRRRPPAHGIAVDCLCDRALSPRGRARSVALCRFRPLGALAEHRNGALSAGRSFPPSAFLWDRVCFDAAKRSDALGARHLQFWAASPRRTNNLNWPGKNWISHMPILRTTPRSISPKATCIWR